jgi:hypothetical protein
MVLKKDFQIEHRGQQDGSRKKRKKRGCVSARDCGDYGAKQNAKTDLIILLVLAEIRQEPL